MTAGDLSIVIPTRDRWDTLQLTLAALEAQTVRGFEIIVVVDGTDQAVPELPGVRVLRQEHAGPAAARNRGVDASDRQLILFMGDDMVPTAGFVARHLARHHHEPDCEVAVLGRIEWHSSVPRDRIHRWLDWSGALFDYRVLEEQRTTDACWPRFYSSNVSMKRDLFLAAGGFDPDFRFDYEDLDFGWRLGRLGLRLLYEPAAAVRHLHPYDWSAVERRYVSRAGAERLMMSKHDWFRPWFHRHIEAAVGQPPSSASWTRVVDWIPARAGRLRRAAERRANRHYLQRLAPSFLAAWEKAEAPAEPAHASSDRQGRCGK
jgi:GT2 family glycosyltransferase